MPRSRSWRGRDDSNFSITAESHRAGLFHQVLAGMAGPRAARSRSRSSVTGCRRRLSHTSMQADPRSVAPQPLRFAVISWLRCIEEPKFLTDLARTHARSFFADEIQVLTGKHHLAVLVDIDVPCGIFLDLGAGFRTGSPVPWSMQ